MTDSWTEDDEEPTSKVRIEGPPLQFHPQGSFYPASEDVQRQMTEREQLRQAELEHLTQLRAQVQEGMDHGRISMKSGTQMLLNISRARMALAGVGTYPGAW
jgi:hypothetical protein